MKIDTSNPPRVSCPRCFVDGATDARVVPAFGICQGREGPKVCGAPTTSIVGLIVAGKMYIMEVCEAHADYILDDKLEHRCGR